MNTNKILIAGIVGGVASFIFGWLIYGMLLANFWNANLVSGVMKEPGAEIMWAVVVASLFLGFFFAVIYGRWAGIKTFKTGAIAGLVIGLLMVGHISFVMYGTANYYANLTSLLVDIVAATAYSGLVGGVVGWMFGRGND